MTVDNTCNLADREWLSIRIIRLKADPSRAGRGVDSSQ